MILTINGQQAALKKGSSIEYVSENRIFTDADDYSMEIELPLADCPQNLDIFGMITRKDVDTGDIFFDGGTAALRKRPEGRWLGESIKGGRNSLCASNRVSVSYKLHFLLFYASTVPMASRNEDL